MPLTPKYTWEEDVDGFALAIHLPGSTVRSVDVYVSDLVVKVNSPPYVLLLDLFDFVDDASTTVKHVAAKQELRIAVKKREPRLWGQLECKDSKQALKQRRHESMERQRRTESERATKRSETKHEEERKTLRAQMAVDDTNRQILSDLKAEEKAREEEAMYESFKELQMKKQQQQQRNGLKNATSASKGTAPQVPREQTRPAEMVERASSKTKKREKKSVRFALNEPPTVPPVFEAAADGCFDISSSLTPAPKAENNVDNYESEDISSENELPSPATVTPASAITAANVVKPKEPEVVVVELPPPRARVDSTFAFTPRVFPTPSRESKAADEEDWLLKNRKYLKKHQGLGAAARAYDISETDPMWLKAKGDDFYRSKDYRSAANAFTEALALMDENHELRVPCLSNRAACWLQLDECSQCVNDCTTALSFLPDTRDQGQHDIKSFRLKLKLFIRRGSACCRLGQFGQAKADYGTASAMDPQNEALKDDFLTLVAMEKAQELKESGDACVKEQQLAKAVEHYTQALRLDQTSIACLSNRAVCHLMLHNRHDCVNDCTSALQLLQSVDSHKTVVTGPNNSQTERLCLSSFSPAAGSATRRGWVVKTLARRGAAYIELEEWKNAEDDYAAAAELEPSNQGLLKDLNKIRHHRQHTGSAPAAA
ncbi:TPA: hypothetical protein N0F65_012437 [Lagenidium giganteum]|uniref:CS domain-containing protein n=1 Tax=Lagenidium giganteum TaxID=4803 RepID=A0AAV2YDI0_9STRA|nr:TPA: hypothetical protein N0F65_012437 [Lagenidium giganteum]